MGDKQSKQPPDGAAQPIPEKSENISKNNGPQQGPNPSSRMPLAASQVINQQQLQPSLPTASQGISQILVKQQPAPPEPTPPQNSAVQEKRIQNIDANQLLPTLSPIEKVQNVAALKGAEEVRKKAQVLIGGSSEYQTLVEQMKDQSNRQIPALGLAHLLEVAPEGLKHELMENKVSQQLWGPILLLNHIRAQPKAFARDCLEPLRSRFQPVPPTGELYYLTLDDQRAIKHPHGLRTLDAIITKLNSNFKPQSVYTHIHYDPVLQSAAQEHVDDIGPCGLFTDDSSIGLSLGDRIPKGQYPGMLFQKMAFGSSNSIECILMMLLYNNDENKLLESFDMLTDPIHQRFGFAHGKHASDLSYMGCLVGCLEWVSPDQMEHWREFSQY
ncbi:hypothetical protein FGO68_gene14157 [Halteria grandinella]|uniref:Uncharacterized protein n=1 Tax=Halteria grandinella TaxID=5974 RepID=A0A8J8T0Y7_HALGN|nr:hypothetical protein FGO68_gene14157 [Halteria grandinella]